MKATVIGSFKLWPAKINQGNLYALTLSLRCFDESVWVFFIYVTFRLYTDDRIWRKRGVHPDRILWTVIGSCQRANQWSAHWVEHVEIRDLCQVSISKVVDIYKHLGKPWESWSFTFFTFPPRFQNIHKLTWEFVNSVCLHKYPNILTLVDLLLTLPASSAEVGRGFSQMQRTESQMHAKIKADSMSDLLIIQLNSPDINNFDPREAIHLWNVRALFSAGDTRPISDCSSNSGSHDESD